MMGVYSTTIEFDVTLGPESEAHIADDLCASIPHLTSCLDPVLHKLLVG